MTLGNMRTNGVRSLDVSCWQCHHRAIMSVDPWPDDVPVPAFRPSMVCTRWGAVGIEYDGEWRRKQPDQPSRAKAVRLLTTAMLHILAREPGEKRTQAKWR
jgi:hypothetical protein